MAHQKLNGTEVSAGFEQMNGERVPEGMGCDRFGQTRNVAGFLTNAFDGGSGYGLARTLARE
jgi:hypothetical protein